MIFLSGLSRSGTTLCQGMITNSPDTIGMTSEASYFRALMDAYKQSKHPGFQKHLEDYFGEWGNFKSFHQHKVLSPYLDQVQDNYYSGFDTYYEIVQKEPRLLRVWPELYDFFPDAKYVIVYRDPRDILASQMKRMEGKKWDINQWWSEQLSNLAYALKGPQENIWVRYEDLVTQPQATLDQLEKSLGIEIPLSEWQVKRKDDSCSPLDGKLPDPSSIGKWREVLPEETAEEVERWKPWFEKTTDREWFWYR